MRWAKYLALLDEDKSELRMIPEDSLFPDGKVTEAPPILATYYRTKNYGNWVAGGVEDQPHILLAELDRCRMAEAEFQAVVGPKLERIAHASQSTALPR